jgi:hypothetical protein
LEQTQAHLLSAEYLLRQKFPHFKQHGCPQTVQHIQLLAANAAAAAAAAAAPVQAMISPKQHTSSAQVLARHSNDL